MVCCLHENGYSLKNSTARRIVTCHGNVKVLSALGAKIVQLRHSLHGFARHFRCLAEAGRMSERPLTTAMRVANRLLKLSSFGGSPMASNTQKSASQIGETLEPNRRANLGHPAGPSTVARTSPTANCRLTIQSRAMAHVTPISDARAGGASGISIARPESLLLEAQSRSDWYWSGRRYFPATLFSVV